MLAKRRNWSVERAHPEGAGDVGESVSSYLLQTGNVSMKFPCDAEKFELGV